MKVKDLMDDLSKLDQDLEIFDQSSVQDMGSNISVVSLTVKPVVTYQGVVILEFSQNLYGTTIDKILEHRKKINVVDDFYYKRKS